MIEKLHQRVWNQSHYQLPLNHFVFTEYRVHESWRQTILQEKFIVFSFVPFIFFLFEILSIKLE